MLILRSRMLSACVRPGYPENWTIFHTFLPDNSISAIHIFLHIAESNILKLSIKSTISLMTAKRKFDKRLISIQLAQNCRLKTWYLMTVIWLHYYLIRFIQKREKKKQILRNMSEFFPPILSFALCQLHKRINQSKYW